MTERTAQMAKGPAAPLLDDASGPLGAGLSVKQWAARCDAAVSEVAESWRTVKTSRNGAKVVMGRFPGSPVTSVGW